MVPVHIKEILGCEEEHLKVEGQEVGMVSVIGQVKTVNHEATKSVYGIEDASGLIDVIQWLDEGKDSTKDSVVEDCYVRVVGSIRTNKDRKYVMAFKIMEVENKAEIKGHLLDVEYAKLKIKHLKNLEDKAINGTGAGLSNSMMMTGGSYASSASAMSTGSTFSNPKHDSTFKMISSCTREEGIGRDELLQSLKGKLSKSDLDDAIEFLSGDGHIYSTIDEDHFRTTDS